VIETCQKRAVFERSSTTWLTLWGIRVLQGGHLLLLEPLLAPLPSIIEHVGRMRREKLPPPPSPPAAEEDDEVEHESEEHGGGEDEEDLSEEDLFPTRKISMYVIKISIMTFRYRNFIIIEIFMTYILILPFHCAVRSSLLTRRGSRDVATRTSLEAYLGSIFLGLSISLVVAAT
jgi:hypothetical protein